MTFRFYDALKYVDNLVAIGSAVAGYALHRDESQLADEISMQILEAVRETIGDIDVVDADKIRNGVVMIVDGLEPLL